MDLFVAVALPILSPDLLYHNAGDGTLHRIAEGPPVSSNGTGIGCAWADYDNDGDTDLYVVNSWEGEANFLFRNEGHGQFIRMTVGPQVTDVLESYEARWGDYDNDGDFDLYVTEAGPENSFTEMMATASSLELRRVRPF